MIRDFLKSNKITRDSQHFKGKNGFDMSGGRVTIGINVIDLFHISDHLEQFGGILFF